MSIIGSQETQNYSVILGNDNNQTIVAVPELPQAEQLAESATTFGIPADIKPRKILAGDSKNFSLSSICNRYEQIFGHTNFIGNNKDKK